MMMNLEPAKFERFVHHIFTTRPDEIDCETLYYHLDVYADMVVAGKDAALTMPRVHAHLMICQACREEYETLLAALRWLSSEL